jgi:DNA-binding response OmpR family regulator
VQVNHHWDAIAMTRKEKRKQRAGPRLRKPALFINGERVSASSRHVALFTCLRKNLGRVVSYERLFSCLGHKSRRKMPKHLLRQYMTWIKHTLSTHEVPNVLTVAQNVGYALCKVAD